STTSLSGIGSRARAGSARASRAMRAAAVRVTGGPQRTWVLGPVHYTPEPRPDPNFPDVSHAPPTDPPPPLLSPPYQWALSPPPMSPAGRRCGRRTGDAAVTRRGGGRSRPEG